MHSKSYTVLNIELWVRHSALHSKLFLLNIELWVDVQLCIQHYTHFEYRAIGSHSDLHSKTYIFIFKECLVLNVELNVDLTARYSGRIFSNAELNVDPIARYSKRVWC